MTLQELFDKEDKWCQHSFALSPERQLKDPLDPTACSWCLRGGMWKVGYGIDLDAVEELLDVYDVIKWNDAPERTFQDIQEAAKKIDELWKSTQKSS